MSPCITDTLISNGVEDIRGIPIHLTTSAVILTEAPARVGSRCDCPQNPGSENVKSSHQFLARFHRLRWIHPTEHFFPTLTIHCCEFAHDTVVRYPFCVFACSHADRDTHGTELTLNVC